jgi:serine protein kinase
MDAKSIYDIVEKSDFGKQYEELNWTGSFEEYLDMVIESPRIARTAFQRMADMILGYGYEEYTEYKKNIKHYNFFDDPIDNGKDAIFGLDVHIQKLVNVFKAGARKYGPEKRVVLLHGPVGSSKSTITRLLKKGLERYSRPRKAHFTPTPGKTCLK